MPKRLFITLLFSAMTINFITSNTNIYITDKKVREDRIHYLEKVGEVKEGFSEGEVSYFWHNL